MTHAEGELNIDPGKQLPQKVIVATMKKAIHMPSLFATYFSFPKITNPHGNKWPLILFLHGIGEAATTTSISSKSTARRKSWSPNPTSLSCSSARSAPKKMNVGHAWKPEEMMQLVDHVASKLNIDLDRIYVTGLSMGGYGTWRLAATYPDRFAAAVPICGGGDAEKLAKPLSKVPIWAFHGGKDTTVPTKQSQDIVDAVKAEHGDIELTIYPDAGHDSWTETYNNPKVYEWLLSHRLHK